MSDLSELFARDPLSYSEQDINIIVAHYQKLRAQFETAALTKPAPKPKPVAKTALNLNINLGKL